ncbi:hypothetical protein KM043_018777 [Ampulex compressa]|uniref:Venom protein n=1 Tax=Ampulex compressa TaxID=860918 RepID=A0A1W6EVP1_AMPCP|nr:venom protein [Ampulex compressa]KAG7196753.1 hypothetical protein KM043_018777 [Ampulex compressa]
MLKATIGLWLLASICGLQIISAFFLPYQRSTLEEYKDYIQNATNEINQNVWKLKNYHSNTKIMLYFYLTLMYNTVCYNLRKTVANKLGDIRVAMMIEQEKCKDVEKCYDDAENKINKIENSTISELQQCSKISLDYYDTHLETINHLENEGQQILIAFRHIFAPCMDTIPMDNSCMYREIMQIKARMDNFNKKFNEADQRNRDTDTVTSSCWICLQKKVNSTSSVITEVMKQSVACMEVADADSILTTKRKRDNSITLWFDREDTV